jgi:universal stress protein A
MLKYKHILAATDFHKEDLPVITKAVELAKQYDAELSVVHVVPSVPYYMASGLSSISDIEDHLEDQTKERLTDIEKEFDIKIKTHMVHGLPKKEIVALADELKADLIIVGSHGKHGAQLLLGSTASGVMHRAHCDLLLVRSKV